MRTAWSAACEASACFPKIETSSCLPSRLAGFVRFTPGYPTVLAQRRCGTRPDTLARGRAADGRSGIGATFHASAPPGVKRPVPAVAWTWRLAVIDNPGAVHPPGRHLAALAAPEDVGAGVSTESAAVSCGAVPHRSGTAFVPQSRRRSTSRHSVIVADRIAFGRSVAAKAHVGRGEKNGQEAPGGHTGRRMPRRDSDVHGGAQLLGRSALVTTPVSRRAEPMA